MKTRNSALASYEQYQDAVSRMAALRSSEFGRHTILQVWTKCGYSNGGSLASLYAAEKLSLKRYYALLGLHLSLIQARVKPPVPANDNKPVVIKTHKMMIKHKKNLLLSKITLRRWCGNVLQGKYDEVCREMFNHL